MTQELGVTDIEILRAVKGLTKHSVYGGSFRTASVGAKDRRVIEEVGVEQEFGVAEANQSLLNLLKGVFIVRRADGLLYITNRGEAAIAEAFREP